MVEGADSPSLAAAAAREVLAAQTLGGPSGQGLTENNAAQRAPIQDLSDHDGSTKGAGADVTPFTPGEQLVSLIARTIFCVSPAVKNMTLRPLR